MTNDRGKPFYDLLRKAGLPVQGVVVLGRFIHVECLCEETARKVAHLLTQAKMEFLKITHRVDRAKHPNMERAQCGMSTWVHRYTAHFKA